MYSVLLAFLEIYTGLLIVLIVSQYLKKKKLPRVLLVFELICIAAFFYIRYLMEERRIILVGEYIGQDDEDWGAVFGNTMTYANNLALLMGIFLFTQIIFWILYIKRIRLLNRSNDEQKIKQPGQLL